MVIDPTLCSLFRIRNVRRLLEESILKHLYICQSLISVRYNNFMSEKFNFAKAKEKSEVRKRAGSREQTLNPRGPGGPIFDDILNQFEQLGTREADAESIKRLRRMFEYQLRKRTLDIYNEHLQGEKGVPSHSKFEKEVREAYLYGFQLYLKVALRLNESDAPGPHKKIPVRDGGRTRMMSDDRDKAYYLQQYLMSGNEVLESNGVLSGSTPEEKMSLHDFEPSEDAVAYAKFERVPGVEDDWEATTQSYMLEKFKVYSEEFFELLNEALARGVQSKDAIDLATYAYGNDASIFAEMEAYGVKAQTVAAFSITNRARVRVPFEKYMTVGKDLEEKYPFRPASGGWVTSRTMIRNLTFKYPSTIEAGLQVVERDLNRLREKYPQVPRSILIDFCVENPDTYEKKISEYVQTIDQLMKAYPASPEYGVREAKEGVSVFEHYQVAGPLMNFIERVSVKKRDEKIAAVLTKFAEAINLASDAGIEFIGTFSSYRRMLRSLLLYNVTPDQVVDREERLEDGFVTKNSDLFKKAYHLDSMWGSYFVELGYGTRSKIVENGQAAVEIIRDQYGDSDGEDHIRELIDLHQQYLAAGFKDCEDDDIQALKDALIMDTENPKEFYESVLRRKWPADIAVISRKEF